MHVYPDTIHLHGLKEAGVFYDLSVIAYDPCSNLYTPGDNLKPGKPLVFNWIGFFTGIKCWYYYLKNKQLIILTFNAIISLPSLVFPIEKRNALSNVLLSSFSFLLICETDMI